MEDDLSLMVIAPHRKGASIVRRQKRRDIALLNAAESGHEDCVQELIKHGADIWCANKPGQNLLMVVSSHGLCKTIKACLENGSLNRSINVTKKEIML